MATPIGALRAELSASIAKFKEDMGKAADQVRSFAKSAEKEGKRLERVGKKLSIALTAPIVAFGYKAVQSANQYSGAVAQVEAALASMGPVSARTTEQLRQSASALESLSLFDDADILHDVTANLLRFGNISGTVFDRAQQAAVDLSARLGHDLAGAATEVGKALNDPIRGITALRRVGIQFTRDQVDMIKVLISTGRGLEAQTLILDKFEREFGGAAKAARDADPFAALNQSIRDLLDAAGPLIIELIKPLTAFIKVLADSFSALSPTMKQVVIYSLAIAAALGPVIAIFGRLYRVVASLTPALTGLFGAFSVALGISLGALLGWAAALAAAIGAVYIFWRSIKAILRGDFRAAWEEAKTAARKLVDDVTGLFKSTPAQMPVVVVPPDPGATDGLPPNFDIPEEVQNATDRLTEALRGMDQKITSAFGKLELPKSIAAARDLNAQIDEFIHDAREAGVNTDKFAGSIGSLRDRIEELKQAGLAEEAKKFGREVASNDVAIRRFAFGSLDPLSDRLESVDTAYQGLHDKLEAQIEDNQVLAESNDEAARAMARLQAQLVALERAHASATQAAREQWRAENLLRDLESQASNLQTRQQIDSLRRASGPDSALSSQQERLRSVQEGLDRQRIDAAVRLQALENDLSEARRIGDDDAIARLGTEIELQREFFDLIHATTASQMEQAERVNAAFRSFTDTLADDLTDAVSTWSLDLQGVRNIFSDLAKDLFLKPFLTSASEGISGFLQGAVSNSGGFAGLFAGGGFVPPGQWAIAGEHGPEPVFGGTSGLSVVSNGDSGAMGGKTVVQNFNISTPDANSFRMSQRQIARSAKQRLSL